MTTTLGSVVRQVLETGEERSLDTKQCDDFYAEFYDGISERIEEIRSEQRRAFEEAKNVIVA